MTSKSKKKNAKLKKSAKNSLLPNADPWLSQLSEDQILQLKSEEVIFFKKDDKILLLLPISTLIKEHESISDPALYDQTKYILNHQRFNLNDPNLGFYLIHFRATVKNIEKIIHAQAYFFPDEKPLVEQSIGLDDSLLLEHKIDPTGDLQKKLFVTKLLFLGHSLVSYAIIRGNELALMTLLKHMANPNQLRHCSDQQMDLFLNLKKIFITKQIKYINSLNTRTMSSHITFPNNDLFIIEPPYLKVTFKYLSDHVTFDKCKIFYYVHDQKCTLSGFKQLADGSFNTVPENIKNIPEQDISIIESSDIRIDQPKQILIFLKIGTLGLHWFDNISPLYIATNNNHIPSIKALMSYKANPFYNANPKIPSPLELVLLNEKYELLPSFYDQLKLFDVDNEVNIINTLFNNGYLRVAHATINLNATLIDSSKVVEMHAAKIAIMISQKNNQQDQKWLNYIASTKEPIQQQINTIMDEAEPSAITDALFSYADLVITLWKKYPLTNDQLKRYVDWCITNEQTMPLEIMIVKLDTHFTLNANAICHDQLKYQYPNHVRFLSEDNTVVHGKISIVNHDETNEVINERKTINEINSILDESHRVLDQITDEQPINISYRQWFELNFLSTQTHNQIKRLVTIKIDVKENFDEIIRLIVNIRLNLSLIMCFKKTVFKEKTDTIFNGKLEKDLTESLKDIVSLFDEIEASDALAINIANKFSEFKDELKTTLICDHGYFIKQFAMIIKYALNLPNQLNQTNKNDLLEKINNIIIVSSYHIINLELHDKDSLCDMICDWVYKENKSSAHVIAWVNNFHNELMQKCHLQQTDGLPETSLTYLALAQTPQEKFILQVSKCLKSLASSRDQLNLNKNNFVHLSKEASKIFMDANQLDFKKIIININKIASLSLRFLHDKVFKTFLKQDDYESIKIALCSIFVSNQSEMNHKLLKLHEYDLWQKPQFIIGIIEIIDPLSSIFDDLTDHITKKLSKK
ncbi:MAG: hypothetical protein VX835_01120 [Pseudomonadota bacterium]|nr:hypothetical protein [Pseudomonadota bacterium]